ncbi:hypothetical protein FRC04_004104 [Tulasnella sp. 424]|nr:hypothetical protein FRC04_004104 [Tulasnella sp. 424]KAG8967652.1 hypothetical protein FRC05_001984 [Tulasnella sp. 425]
MANASQATTRPSARTLTTLPAILTSLSEIEALESSLSASLSNLLASQQPIINSLTRLQSLVPHVEELMVDANLLADKVGGTAKTAQRVGGKVRTLDEEMRRVRDASERVAAVTELKLSLADLHSSIEAQDWETATRHCARAMAVPPEIIKGPFAESVVPTADLPLPPSETLQEAREKLLRIFRVEFGKASQARDSANTSRFFKLFPAIGWEKEGLEAYSGFVVDLVRGRATVSGKSESLSWPYHTIALIVDQHQPIVEKYYGSGKMLSVVARLLQECDRVVGGLIESWEEERQMQRKPQRRGTQLSEDDGPDPREIDKVLTEVAGLAGRWALFRRFLTERLKDEHGSNPQSPDGSLADEEVDKTTEAKPEPTSTEQGNSTSPEVELIESSGCRSMMAQLISTYYIPLETWYLRSVIDKAHRVSAPDSSEPPQTTTPDDVFYILKLVISRLLTTGSVDCVERMAQVISGTLERDLAGVIRKKMEDIYSPSAQMARGNAAQREKTERENRSAFIIQLNDLDISSAHMETLIKNVVASPQIQQNFLETDVAPTQEHVSAMLKLTTKFQSILKWGVEQLFNQLTRPKLRSLIVEVYKDVAYMLDDDSYASAEYQDVVRKRFVKAWDALVDGFKDTFTERNYRAFFSLAVEVLVRPWEKHILSMKFTELGAIRFDKDLRSITAYLSTQTAFGDTREKFLRLQQISTILNLDLEEDPDEFYSSSGISWKLSQNEARIVASLRVS